MSPPGYIAGQEADVLTVDMAVRAERQAAAWLAGAALVLGRVDDDAASMKSARAFLAPWSNPANSPSAGSSSSHRNTAQEGVLQ